jgi:hypothetical protein
MTRPAIGTRIPTGAIAEGEQGLRLIRAARLPEARSLGSERLTESVHHALSDTDQPLSFNELSPEVGPQVLMGPLTATPEGVGDPVRWVAGHILPV